MKYNPEIHKRKSIRLKGYDYSLAGLYFITICCDDRICRFGHIVGEGLALPIKIKYFLHFRDLNFRDYSFLIPILKDSDRYNF